MPPTSGPQVPRPHPAGPRAGGSLRWSLQAEHEIPADGHEELAEFLRRVYPDDAGLLAGSRSWTGARPEHRVLGRRPDGAVVAHLGFVVRPVQREAAPVADVGLVGVEPHARGTGVGRALLAEATTAVRHLGLPFGFLTCLEEVVGFYRAGGWQRLPPTPVRMTSVHGVDGVHHGPALVLPVTAPLADWPAGPLDRDGTEV